MEKTPTLIVSLPDGEAKTFELHGERVGLGREIDNQVQVPVGAVSSCHCEFRRETGGYTIADLDSTNGTRVNGKKIEAQPLHDGDRILLGETIAVHYVELAEGEETRIAATAGDAGQNAAGASYAKFDEKLQSIEADIAAKQTEHEELAAALEAKRAEHDGLLASMTQLEEQIAAAKATAGERDQQEVAKEVAELEKELMLQTRKVQTLASDIDGQQKQMQQMVPGAPAPVLPGAPAPAPAAPPATPVIKVTAMTPPQAEGEGTAPAATPPPAAAPPTPAPAPAPAPLPVPLPLDPAHAEPPKGAKTVVIEQPAAAAAAVAPAIAPGAGPRKLLIEEPTKPRPKFNLD